MGLAPGYHGFGTGPAGKVQKNTMGPRPSPKRQTHIKTCSTRLRGGVSIGSLGKRGR